MSSCHVIFKDLRLNNVYKSFNFITKIYVLSVLFATPSPIRPNRQRPARSEENIAAVAESVHEDRGESIRRRLQ